MKEIDKGFNKSLNTNNVKNPQSNDSELDQQKPSMCALGHMIGAGETKCAWCGRLPVGTEETSNSPSKYTRKQKLIAALVVFVLIVGIVLTLIFTLSSSTGSAAKSISYRDGYSVGYRLYGTTPFSSTQVACQSYEITSYIPVESIVIPSGSFSSALVANPPSPRYPGEPIPATTL